MTTAVISAFLTLSNSIKRSPWARFKRFPSRGTAGGPGGKFLGLFDFSCRIRKKTQKQSNAIETNMVTPIRMS